MKSYKNLIIWQKSNELILLIYKETLIFPSDEAYGLTSQLRRAGLSVVLNIVEGHARRSGSREFSRFLSVSLGSLAEVEYLLELSRELSYLTTDRYREVEKLREECGKMIWTYRNRLLEVSKKDL